MYKHLVGVCFILFIQAANVVATEINEQGKEFIKIEIDYHNETTGLIWAYRCLSCTPERFLFDSQTIVQENNEKFGVSRLKAINEKAATVIWVPNTSKVLRVLPMELD